MIELKLNTLSNLKERNFGLVFLYAEEAADARIRAYLDKFFIKHVGDMIASQQSLREYISTKILRSDDQICPKKARGIAEESGKGASDNHR